MHLARRFQHIGRHCNVRLMKTTATAATSAEEQIVIPNRIKRSPTAILEALSSTVGRDPTAPHYKFHDDPYLIPTSNVSKRTFAMAQESGRKAAKWIKEEHRKLFMVYQISSILYYYCLSVMFSLLLLIHPSASRSPTTH